VPISATSGTLPPAIAVVNLSCACAHGTNSMFTFVPGCLAWKSVAYPLKTSCSFGEPGSMIQVVTSPETPPFAAVPSSLPSSSPPHPATASTPASAPAASHLIPFIATSSDFPSPRMG
jgi:hypothetical protein